MNEQVENLASRYVALLEGLPEETRVSCGLCGQLIKPDDSGRFSVEGMQRYIDDHLTRSHSLILMYSENGKKRMVLEFSPSSSSREDTPDVDVDSPKSEVQDLSADVRREERLESQGSEPSPGSSTDSLEVKRESAGPTELKQSASPQTKDIEAQPREVVIELGNPTQKPPVLQSKVPVKKKVKGSKVAAAIKITVGEKVNKSPAFQLYASDFYMDTSGWTCTEVGAYFRLLMSEWVNGPLPNDTEHLARIAQIDHGNFKKLWRPTIEEKFVPNGNGTLINNRLERVRERQRKYRESQAQKGKYGAEKRWGENIAGAIAGAINDAKPVLQPKDSSSSSSLNNKNHYAESSESLRLAALLLEEIRKNKVDFKEPNLQTWAKTIDLMIRRDHRSADRVEKVVRWVQSDHGDGNGNWRGWASVILSPGKLREKFDELELRCQDRSGTGRSKPSW